MELFKVTATHKNDAIRVALAATAEDAQSKADRLAAAGYWENIAVVAVMAVPRKVGRR